MRGAVRDADRGGATLIEGSSQWTRRPESWTPNCANGGAVMPTQVRERVAEVIDLADRDFELNTPLSMGSISPYAIAIRRRNSEKKMPA